MLLPSLCMLMLQVQPLRQSLLSIHPSDSSSGTGPPKERLLLMLLLLLQMPQQQRANSPKPAAKGQPCKVHFC